MFGNVEKIVISSQFTFQEILTVYSFNIANLFKNIPHLLEGIKGDDKSKRKEQHQQNSKGTSHSWWYPS